MPREMTEEKAEETRDAERQSTDDRTDADERQIDQARSKRSVLRACHSRTPSAASPNRRVRGGAARPSRETRLRLRASPASTPPLRAPRLPRPTVPPRSPRVPLAPDPGDRRRGTGLGQSEGRAS